MDENANLGHLSPRQKTCLGMVASHVSPKQVARELGLSENTVRGYLTEAINILGASDLRHASRLFLEASKITPLILRGHFQRVANESPAQAEAAPEEKIEQVVPSSDGTTQHPSDNRVRFHLHRARGQDNDLNLRQRILFIISGAILSLILLNISLSALFFIGQMTR